MAEERVQRRLSAVLAADVVGYSRLVGADEQGTLSAFKDHLTQLIEPSITQHRGRVVKTMGDGVLAEFASAVDAVLSAREIQAGMTARNGDVPEDRRLWFRIGINVGDIVIDGDDIQGDGVNIAARLEGIADSGGICISGTAYDQVQGKVDAGFVDLGEQQVKNIARPIRAYKVTEPGEAVGLAPPTSAPWKTRTAAAAIALLVTGGGLAWWAPWTDADGPASVGNSAFKLPDKPSIAVLPFGNLSGEASQEPFADGMTEDLITDLSKVSGLFVVAPNSSFAYKGKSVDIRTVAAELGVRYVLEGSIRKSGNKVRINAQLIDAATGGHLWAERYDGSVDDVFELQDKVGARVVSALAVQLTRNETDGLTRVHTKNLAAYELFLRARTTLNPPIPERIKSANRMFQRVTEMDPSFAGGYAGVSFALGLAARFGRMNTDKLLEQAHRLARKAISVDKTFGWSYVSLGWVLIGRGQYDEAILAAREAIARQPSDADSHSQLAVMLGLAGQYAASVKSVNSAIRLNPKFYDGPYLNIRGVIQIIAGDYDAGLKSFQENVDRGGPVAIPVISFSAAAHSALGRPDEAARLAEQLRTDFPRFTMTNWNFIKLIRDPAARERLVRNMRAAGVS